MQPVQRHFPIDNRLIASTTGFPQFGHIRRLKVAPQFGFTQVCPLGKPGTT